jgi:hypothetical protein
VSKKSILVTAALVMITAGAQARDVYWSVGINAPLQPGVSVGTVFSNAPVYQPAPVYYQPAPVIYAEPAYYPQPVYVQPRMVYAPQPVYLPQRVVYGPGWVRPGHGHRQWRQEHRHRGEPVMVGYGGR